MIGSRAWAWALVLAACGGNDGPSGPGGDASILVGQGAFDLGSTSERDGGSEPPEVGGPNPGPDAGIPEVGGPDGGDGGSPCEQRPEVELSEAEAEMRVNELAGRLVRVLGVVEADPPECASAPCPGGDVCCNRCRAALRVGGWLRLAPSPCTGTSTIGCAGGACDPLVCTPPAFGSESSYDGWLRAGSDPRLEVIRVLP